MDLTGHVHLLLGTPGHAPAALPDSPWRVAVLGPTGMADPASVASSIRLSPMSPRGERTLVQAVAADDVDTIARLCEQPGPLQEAARLLYASRLVALDPEAAAAVLGHILAAPTDPAQSKILRRHWPNLHIATAIAPSVPALVPVSQVGVGLLLAEVRASQGRMSDAIVVLSQLPPQPAVHLAMAAGLLATGEHSRVLDITSRVRNVDDLSALGLVARSVAARTLGDLPGALDAVCGALLTTERAPGVLAAALEERAHLYSLLQDDIAARADLDVLALLAGGSQQIVVPEPAKVRRPGEDKEERSLDRARDRMRRRITGVGAPGTFGGRHHSTYRDEIADMFALGKLAAVEELLLGLLDAVEDEVSELGAALDPTFFLTLADLYQDSGRHEDLVALRERFASAEARAAQTAPAIVDEVVGAALVVPDIERSPSGDPTLATPPAPPPPDNPFVVPAATPLTPVPAVRPRAAAAPVPAVEPPAPAPAEPVAPAPAPLAAAASSAPAAGPVEAPDPVAAAAALPVEAPLPVAEVIPPPPVPAPAPDPATEVAPAAQVAVEPVAPAAPEVAPPDASVAAPAPNDPMLAPAEPEPEPVLVSVSTEPAAAAASVEVSPTPGPDPQPIAEPLPVAASAAALVVGEEAPPPAAADADLPNRAREDGRTSLIAMASAPVTPLTPSAARAAARAAAEASAAEGNAKEPEMVGAGGAAEHELTPVERAIRGPRLRSL